MLHRNMLPVAPFELTILLFVFLSGAASLVYETIWFRQLSILFGNSTYAAATTLSVFFLGLAVGSYFFGRFTVKNPIKAYSIIELGIGFSALLYFLLLNLFVLLRPLISFGAAAPQNAVIFLISIVLLFPASFFIGGTLPIIGQVLVRSKDQLFKTTSIFYGVNTLGAVAGILLAGFILPVLLGFTKTYTLAIVVNFLIAGGAFALYKAHHSEPLERAQEKVSRTVNIKREYYLIIFLSGFITLGLEVLWTQMFAQEILNDVYSFSLVLFTIILALSIGSFASKKLDGARNPQRVIFYLLV
ncbi:MAG: fused MFS/spermidine synthase, partial [Dehalococcoidia bacterium]